MSTSRYVLQRRDVVSKLLAECDPDTLLVTGLGSTTWDAAAAGDRDGTFYLWGAMGGAVMIGLGVALAQPDRRVLVITGDGEMLMGIGSLATVAVQAPPNLDIVVIDNEHYGETGMQPTHTQHGVDLAAMAEGAGLPDSRTIVDDEQLQRYLTERSNLPGPSFSVVKVSIDPTPMVLPSRDGTLLKHRFRQHVLGRSDE